MRLTTVTLAVLVAAVPAHAQLPDAKQMAQERRQAEFELPQLVDALGIERGMTVADVGAGFGATTVVLSNWIGTGRVFATDVGQRQITAIREYIAREGLSNVTVIEGAAAATNLPTGCCDAIFMRDVYHHVTSVKSFNESLLASLKSGGRLAIIDFVPGPGSKLPAGVPENRGGHGVPMAVVEDELKAAGFTHLRTIPKWPEGDKYPLFLVLFRKP